MASFPLVILAHVAHPAVLDGFLPAARRLGNISHQNFLMHAPPAMIFLPEARATEEAVVPQLAS